MKSDNFSSSISCEFVGSKGNLVSKSLKKSGAVFVISKINFKYTN